MNTKGEVTIGMFITATIIIIVGAILFTSIAQNVGDTTTLYTVTNENVTLPAYATVTDFPICGQQNTSAVTLANTSTAIVITTANYTISRGIGDDGYYVTQINMTADSAGIPGNNAMVNCTYEPQGYIESAGGRSIAAIIVLLTALGIAIVALYPTLKSKVIDRL